MKREPEMCHSGVSRVAVVELESQKDKVTI